MVIPIKQYPKLIKTDFFNSNGAVIEAEVGDFGAVGDGIADDTAAFKKALEYMRKRASRKRYSAIKLIITVITLYL